MSRQFSRDFLIEVAKGNIAGHSLMHKFGRNDSVPNGSWAHISLTPFDVADFRQSPVSMRVKAGGDPADTAGGAGAREITIQGIDSTFAELSEAVATAGASASAATSATFWRVHRAWVSAVGAYTVANTDDVVIEDSGGAADFVTIAANEGQSQYGGFTIPLGKTGYLLRAWGTVDASKAADFRLYTREEIDTIAAPMPSRRLMRYWDGVLGDFEVGPLSPELILPEKTDIWLEARGGGALTEVSANFEMLLVDD